MWVLHVCGTLWVTRKQPDIGWILKVPFQCEVLNSFTFVCGWEKDVWQWETLAPQIYPPYEAMVFTLDAVWGSLYGLVIGGGRQIPFFGSLSILYRDFLILITMKLFGEFLTWTICQLGQRRLTLLFLLFWDLLFSQESLVGSQLFYHLGIKKKNPLLCQKANSA
jgi:hypothetical protein